MKKAIITGITGQDGAYLAELLLSLDYKVIGTFRRCSTENFWRINELGINGHPNLQLSELDLTDLSGATRLIGKERPDEIYNLAAQSFVGVSFDQPVNTANITGIGALNILEAIRFVDTEIKFYQASTSEMFGKVQSVPQNESTLFYPRSPYATAKLFAHYTTINYRESYNIFGASGILFNHESPLRGVEFVTRKITRHVADYHLTGKGVLHLGNLDASRDWGFAGEYVKGMHLMLQHDIPDTFVLATGNTHTVRDFVRLAYEEIGVVLKWEGKGIAEKAFHGETGDLLVQVDEAFFRPTEVEYLLGDSAKAKKELGWEAEVTLDELVSSMVRKDIERRK